MLVPSLRHVTIFKSGTINLSATQQERRYARSRFAAWRIVCYRLATPADPRRNPEKGTSEKVGDREELECCPTFESNAQRASLTAAFKLPRSTSLLAGKRPIFFAPRLS